MGYIPCVVQDVFLAYFVSNKLYLLIHYPYTASPPCLHPTGKWDYCLVSFIVFDELCFQ